MAPCYYHDSSRYLLMLILMTFLLRQYAVWLLVLSSHVVPLENKTIANQYNSNRLSSNCLRFLLSSLGPLRYGVMASSYTSQGCLNIVPSWGPRAQPFNIFHGFSYSASGSLYLACGWQPRYSWSYYKVICRKMWE